MCKLLKNKKNTQPCILLSQQNTQTQFAAAGKNGQKPHINKIALCSDKENVHYHLCRIKHCLVVAEVFSSYFFFDEQLAN